MASQQLLHEILLRAGADGALFCDVGAAAPTQQGESSRAQFVARAKALAVHLKRAAGAKEGEIVLLMYPFHRGAALAAAFWACLAAGVVPLPLNPLDPEKMHQCVQTLLRIARCCCGKPATERAAVKLLTTLEIAALEPALLEMYPALSYVQFVATDAEAAAVPELAAAWAAPVVSSPDATAFMQVTSGTQTGHARLVPVSHRQAIAAVSSAVKQLALGPQTNLLGWVPVTQDIGLFLFVLAPVFASCPTYLMSTHEFLTNPASWLQLITKYKIEVTAAPPFGYDMCPRYVPEECLSTINLSTLKVAAVVGDVIFPSVLEFFCQRFCQCGFKRNAFLPMYGCAEAMTVTALHDLHRTPVITYVRVSALQNLQADVAYCGCPDTRAVVSCGRVSTALGTVRVVDMATRQQAVPEGVVGEIVVSGPSVAQSYFGDANATAAAFRTPSTMLTSDLGFVLDDQLYVVGRRCDAIRLDDGRFVFPSDIEHTVEMCGAVRQGCVAALFVPDDIQEQRRLVVLAEPNPEATAEQIALALPGIARAVEDEHGVEVEGIHVIKPGSMNCTNNGKVQRGSCLEEFICKIFDSVAQWTKGQAPVVAPPTAMSPPPLNATTPPPDKAAEKPADEAPARKEVRKAAEGPLSARAQEIQNWLLGRCSARLNGAAIDSHAPFFTLGLTSSHVIAIANELEKWLGVRLTPTVLFEYPTMEQLSRYLAGDAAGDDMLQEIDAAPQAANSEPIAIVGMSCRFPGAPSKDAFWDLLVNGVDAIREVPAERFPVDAFYDPEPATPDKFNTRCGGYIDDVDKFDNKFFGIHRAEATLMDPQHRLLLMTTQEAFEDAGIAPDSLSGSSTGVFVGLCNCDYVGLNYHNAHINSPYVATGGAFSIAANRISYLYNLHGPSITMDTACSSTLVALDVAAGYMRQAGCGCAVIGGANLLLSPLPTVALAQSGFLSSDGRCKAFDESANGFVRSEGVGAIVIKQLSQALADGNPVYALIRATAVNQDGQSNGLTAPNPRAQQQLLVEAYKRAGVKPADVQYVECHGTGTALGDPIEVHALSAVLAKGREPGSRCLIGSVKSNIGHLEACAGLAGIMKMALCMHHHKIPPSLHFHVPNPNLNLDKTPFAVVTELTPWEPQGDHPLLGGVSSFGFGGTNSHCVMCSAPAREECNQEFDERYWVLPFSAHTPEALKALARKYRDYLKADKYPLSHICFAAAEHRQHRKYRMAVTGLHAGHMISQLNMLLDEIPAMTTSGKPPRKPVTGSVLKSPNKLCFVFCGQGPQWYGMGRELYLTMDVFRETCEELGAIYEPLNLGWDLREEMSKMTVEESNMDQTKVAQVLLFLFQVGICKLWTFLGLEADAVIGHSLGEIAAAVYAGVLDLEQACALVKERSILMQETTGMGKMCAVNLRAEDVEPFLVPYAATLSIASFNAPKSVVLSGAEDSLAACLVDIQSKFPDCVTQFLPVNYVFHSPQLEPLVPRLRDKLEFVKAKEATRCKLYSTVTGTASNGLDMTADYWSTQIRRPVLFGQAVAAAVNDGCTSFCEISPHPVLSLYIHSVLDHLGVEGNVVPSLLRKERESAALCTNAARLWACGSKVDWFNFQFTGGDKKDLTTKINAVDLPLLAWDTERLWFKGTPAPWLTAAIKVVEQKTAPLEHCIFEERWVKQPLGQQRRHLAAARQSTALVFCDEGAASSASIGKALAAQLASLGVAVVPVKYGTAFAATEGGYTCSPKFEDFEALVEAAAKDTTYIVYCWANDIEAPDYVRAVHAPVNLLRALGKARLHPAVWFVTCGTAAAPAGRALHQYPILGVAGAGSQEYSAIGPVVADISSVHDAPALAQDIAAGAAVSGGELEVSLQRGERFVKRIAPLAGAPAAEWTDLRTAKDAAYLVTGGMGGVGFEVARWLVSRGVTRLYLCGRHEPKPEVAERLDELRKQGADVRVVLADVAQLDQLEQVIKAIDNLRGVVHMAGVFTKHLIDDLTEETCNEVLAPKVLGGWNLHLATKDLPLEHFIVFSSIAAVAPQAGIAHYAAANCFLDALVRHRRALKLPALAVQFGIIGDVGMIRREDPRALSLSARIGHFALSVDDVLRTVSHFAAEGAAAPATVTLARINWPKYLDNSPRASLFATEKEKKGVEAEAESETEAEEEPKTTEEIQQWMVEQFADALHTKASAIDPDMPLKNYGLESMTVVGISSELSAWLNVRVSPTLVFDYPTISMLSAKLAELAGGHSKKAGAGALAQVPSVAPELALADATTAITREPIAVVGMACRLPGGCADLTSYWELLFNGVDAITEIPAARFDVAALYDPDPLKPGHMNSKWGGFVHDIDMFDADFWSISPREAERLDPQQRMVLQCSWEALEDAGISASSLCGTRTGVFVGLSVSDYGQLQLADDNIADAYFATGSFMCMNANRLSYLMDFRGPSVAMDTACSSSLVALHFACQSLLSGECTAALAGGVNAILTPTGGLTLTKTGALSPDGRCFVFDARANGYVRSEGAGMVVVKRLSQARADGDRVYCVVDGTAVNQDGRSNGLTAPNGMAQQAVYEDAWRAAGRSLADAAYLECHGTGTTLGDHIEVDNLGATLQRFGRTVEDPVVIGSVKANIGHLECASGMASLIKVALSMCHAYVPRSIHFENPNPHINFAELPVTVSRGSQWPQGKAKLGGFSSFGFGGTNAHIVVERPDDLEFVPSPAPESADNHKYLLCVSGRASKALQDAAVRLGKFIESHVETPLRDICYTQLLRREQHPLRATFVCSEEARDGVCAALAAFAPTQPHQLRASTKLGAPKVAFVFSGQGPQHFGMARRLLAECPAFRATLAAIDATWATMQSPFSAIAELECADEATSHIGQTVCAQRVLFAIQVALAELYRGMGVVPQAVVGHSLGEIAAAHVAGALSLEEAARLIHVRSEVMNKATGLGKMAAVGIALPECEALIAQLGLSGRIAVAAVNSARSCVLSGDAEGLAQAVAQLQASRKEVYVKYLPVDYAFHSPQMTVFADELLARLTAPEFGYSSAPRVLRVPLYSTLTGSKITGDDLTPQYWQRQITSTVRFGAAVSGLLQQRFSVFLELSPHPVLSYYVLTTLRETGAEGTCVAAMRRGGDDHNAWLQSLGLLHELLVPLDGARLFDDASHTQPPRFVPGMPMYPWQQQRFWFAPATTNEREDRVKQWKPLRGIPDAPVRSPLLPLCAVDAESGGPEVHAWDALVHRGSPLEWEYDHRGFGSVLIPGVSYIECALEAAALAVGPGPQVLTDVKFMRPLFLPDDAEPLIHTVMANSSQYEATVTLYSKNQDKDGGHVQYIPHAEVTVHREKEPWLTVRPEPSDAAAIRARCPVVIEGTDYYTEMWQRGLQLGPAFKSIKRLFMGTNELLGELEVPSHLKLEDYMFHPPVLDATMQCVGAILANRSEEVHGIYLPYHMDRVQYYRQPTPKLYCHVRLSHVSPRALIGDLHIFAAETGEPIAEVFGFRCNYVEDTRRSGDIFYQGVWAPLERKKAEAQPLAEPPTFVVLTDPVTKHGEQFAARLAERKFACMRVDLTESGFARHSDALAQCSAAQADLEKLFAALPTGQPVVVVNLRPARQSDPTAACYDVLAVARALNASGGAFQYWVITFGAQLMPEAQQHPLNLPNAAVWGAANVMMQEYATLNPYIVDLSSQPTSEEFEVLAAEVAHPRADNFLAVRGSAVYGNRLTQAPEPSLSKHVKTAATAIPYRLELTKRGVLDSMILKSVVIPEHLLPGELLIRVVAASMNFRDVMRAMGLYPAEDDSSVVGLEAAGVVERVGAGVTDLAVGDEVVAIANGTFASHFVARHEMCVRKPANLTMEEAVAATGVTLTSYQALVRVAHIAPGERVLVHLASGGVGLTAVQLCQRRGCEVFATVGKKEKRQYLIEKMGVPADHILNSRSLAFADQIMALTHGEGVDVVLNSLMGEGLLRSFELLRHGGRFIEIGKRDIFENSRLPMKPFARNLTIASVAIDVLFDRDQEYARGLLQEVTERLADGTVKPIPFTAFPITEAVQAFRFMAAANHIGKILLTVDQAAPADVVVEAPSTLCASDADGAYVVTGGLGALGSAVGQWLAWHGARRVVLLDLPVARENADALGKIRATGTTLTVLRCNSADKAAVAAVFDTIGLETVRGVFHCAGITDDCLIKELTQERMARVMAPKALGAMALHDVSLRCPRLHHFVLFSSIASVMGAPGQANYACANSLVDALSAERRRLGLPSISINWGPINAGMTARLPEAVRRAMGLQGLTLLSTTEALDVLGSVLLSGAAASGALPAQVAVARIDWAKWAAFSPSSQNPRFVNVVKSATAQTAAGKLFMQKFLALGAGASRVRFVQDKIVESVAAILSFSPDKIDVNRPLTELGLDSMVAVEVRAKLEQEIGVPISIVMLMGGPPIAKIAASLVCQIEQLAGGADAEHEQEQKPVDGSVLTTLVSAPPSVARPRHLFLLPPAGGNTTVFATLAPLLSCGTRSVHVLQKGVGVKDLAQLIDQHVAQIIATDPDGPYTLVGHSLGGMVAYVIARKLELMGRTISHVVLLDSVSFMTPGVTEVEDAMSLFAIGQNMLTPAEARELRDHLRASRERSEGDAALWSAFFDACHVAEKEQREVRELTENLQDDIVLAAQLLKQQEETGYREALQAGRFPVFGVWATDNDPFVVELLQLDKAPTAWRELFDMQQRVAEETLAKGAAEAAVAAVAVPDGAPFTVDSAPGDHWSMLNAERATALAGKVIAFIGTN
eukprot:TRINITY_DN6146_c0_g1_i1.p1 TRINITY_DN6146_c0_g1~~TRINITY_DN6146_c0_g1_i1.p1  ORF type:complete len:4755 (+),score=1300.44 TRINITY_DN6146_c0_g1_i1:55-14265(+)